MLRGIAAVAVLALAGGACTDTDGTSAPDSQSTSTTSVPSGPALAGDLGPNGRVALSGVELESTPESLFDDQTMGGTAVGPVDGVSAGLVVVREDDKICIELHGLPIGGNRLARSCELPAYASHDEVETLGTAFISDVAIDDTPITVVWGATYVDARELVAGDVEAQIPDPPFPFWMHRFFAVAVTGDVASVRLIDDGGAELVELEVAQAT